VEFPSGGKSEVPVREKGVPIRRKGWTSHQEARLDSYRKEGLDCYRKEGVDFQTGGRVNFLFFFRGWVIN
jgi:hypothetical protein